MADINQFVYGVEDDVQLRAQLTDIAKDFQNAGACNDLRGQQADWVAFFSNAQNAQAIKEAFKKYGMPARNRKSYKPKGLFSKWIDYCDWVEIFKFYYYAKVSQDFPALNPEYKDNCYIIKGYLSGLEQEKVNAERENVTMKNQLRYSIQMEILADKIRDFNSLYSSMLCDSYIRDQDSLKSEIEKRKAREASLESLNTAFEKATSVQKKSSNIALYAFGGAAALIAIMFFASRKKS